MNYTETVNMIHPFARKGQAFLSICDFKPTWHSEYFESFPCQFHRVGREINSDVIRAVPRKLNAVSSYSTPDLKNIFPTEGPEPCNNRYVPVATLITFPGDLLEIPSTVIFRRPRRLAGVCIPEILYLYDVDLLHNALWKCV